MTGGKGYKKLFEIMKRLDEAKIWYAVGSSREGYVKISTDVPGQRWEIEIDDNGDIEFEVFKSDGEIHDENVLTKFIEEFSD